MDSKEEKPKARAHVRVILTDEELQLPAIDDLCNKYFDWLKLSKEATEGRKTRAANRRADAIYDEIMAFKLPPVSMTPLQTIPPPPSTNGIQENGNSTKSSVGGDSEGSSVTSVASSSTSGRVLRPRCRTPSVSRKQEASPSTPVHQSIRANLKKNPDSNSSSVLSAALNQQHPSVSVTKIRQLLRADSAQKKREEEKERQERLRLDREAKEKRAETQKKLLLEERAVTAKMKREQRLLHAAEVRKAREKAKIELKLREGLPNVSKLDLEKPKPPPQQQQQPQKQQQSHKHQSQPQQNGPTVKPSEPPQKQKDDQAQTKACKVEDASKKPLEEESNKPRKLDETFQKPADEHDNIDISVHDETTDEPTKKVNAVASWAKAPHLRDLVVAQFKKLEEQILKEAFELFGGVKLPVDLEQIFASHKLPSNKRYLARTSSACWTPPHKPLKRTSSAVFTPTDQKR